MSNVIPFPSSDSDEDDRHEFSPISVCIECDESEDDCECEEPDFEAIDECEECGMQEDSEEHDV